MTIVMPSGYSNFNWSPKKTGLTKTASTGETEKTDKDLLFEAAAKFVKAQAEEKEDEKEEKTEEKVEAKGEEKEEKGEEKSEDKPCDDKGDKPCDDGKAEAAPDVQKAVGELVEKAKKADEVAQKVQDAVAKVEEAVQEVKEVAGVVDGAATDIPGVTGDVMPEDVGSDLGEGIEPPNEVEIELDMPGEDGQLLGGEADLGGSFSEDVGGDMGGLGIEKESLGAMASDANQFVRMSSVSKETASKITKFWKDYLGYAPEYVKLMVKNYEK